MWTNTSSLSLDFCLQRLFRIAVTCARLFLKGMTLQQIWAPNSLSTPWWLSNATMASEAILEDAMIQVDSWCIQAPEELVLIVCCTVRNRKYAWIYYPDHGGCTFHYSEHIVNINVRRRRRCRGGGRRHRLCGHCHHHHHHHHHIIIIIIIIVTSSSLSSSSSSLHHHHHHHHHEHQHL